MSEKFIVRKAEKNDIAEIQTLIKGLATYEKRPQDMTASQEDLCYWIFEKKIATVLIAEYNEEIIGYAIYYPIFGSFAAEAGVHLEDVLLNEKYRHCGLGRKFFSKMGIQKWNGAVWTGIHRQFVFMIKLVPRKSKDEYIFRIIVNKFEIVLKR